MEPTPVFNVCVRVFTCVYVYFKVDVVFKKVAEGRPVGVEKKNVFLFFRFFVFWAR